MYASTAAPSNSGAFDLSHHVWGLWEKPAVAAWLLRSRSRRQLLKRLEVALNFFRSTLRWALSRSLYPAQRLQPLNPEAVDFEEFCWAGVKPTAAAERQILEFAVDIAQSFISEPDVSEQHLYDLLHRRWSVEHPVHDLNRVLYKRLGPIRYAVA